MKQYKIRFRHVGDGQYVRRQNDYIEACADMLLPEMVQPETIQGIALEIERLKNELWNQKNTNFTNYRLLPDEWMSKYGQYQALCISLSSLKVKQGLEEKEVKAMTWGTPPPVHIQYYF